MTARGPRGYNSNIIVIDRSVSYATGNHKGNVPQGVYDGGYAIGAFNVNNMEIVQGITEACAMEKAPVILQVSKGARAYASHTYLVKLVEAALLDCPDIPIALHLDHGPDFETCKACIDGGFTSVMIDGSSKPFAGEHRADAEGRRLRP